MSTTNDKYYLRPNCFINQNFGKKLFKLKKAIKVNNTYFSHIEVIRRNKKKIIRNNHTIEAFYKILKKNKEIEFLFEKLNKPLGTSKNKIFNSKKFIIFGILNLTPDSFSDGGDFVDNKKSIEKAKSMFENGADFIDIGGESTRPGASKVSEHNEVLRVLPTIQALRHLNIPISLDTRNSGTMEVGSVAGVEIINDVSGLENDKKSIDVIRKYRQTVVIMHMPGTPKNMMKKNIYNNVVLDVYDYLEKKINYCLKNKIKRSKIIIDPGIGFGKDLDQNLELLKNLSIFHTLRCPVMIGLSRKRFISSISREDEPKKRLGGTISASLIAMQQGINIHRVHDVPELNQSIKVFEKILNQ